jgi:predicted nucleic acid-binding protein
MKVISNSSPLIFLSAVGLLDLLKKEFEEILVPEAVYKEVTSNNLKGSNEVKNADWIKVQKLANKRSLSFYPVLDEGEEKAIILAIEQKADLLLIDDLAGRRAGSNTRHQCDGNTWISESDAQKRQDKES